MTSWTPVLEAFNLVRNKGTGIIHIKKLGLQCFLLKKNRN